MSPSEMIKAVLTLSVLIIIGCKVPVLAPSVQVDITNSHVVKQLPPQLVSVRGVAWVIENDAKLPNIGLDGLTECGLHKMYVDYNVPDNELRNVVIHELLHAGACQGDKLDNSYWNSYDNPTHEGINRLGQYESELLKENPELTLYLAGLTSK